ncbi:MxaD family protein [Mycolicibacterium porcinum]|nr:MxaD family protein [Mycolicibacterium porcinum]
MRTVSVRSVVAAPIDAVFDWIADGNNWAKVPGMIYSRARPVDGPEPFGVGSTREFLSGGSKVTEVVTAFDRPFRMSYQALSTIPPMAHEGGSVTFREVPGGTEVEWSTTFALKSPVLSDFLTRLYARLIGLGARMVIQAARRSLAADECA